MEQKVGSDGYMQKPFLDELDSMLSFCNTYGPRQGTGYGPVSEPVPQMAAPVNSRKRTLSVGQEDVKRMRTEVHAEHGLSPEQQQQQQQAMHFQQQFQPQMPKMEYGAINEQHVYQNQCSQQQQPQPQQQQQQQEQQQHMQQQQHSSPLQQGAWPGAEGWSLPYPPAPHDVSPPHLQAHFYAQPAPPAGHMDNQQLDSSALYRAQAGLTMTGQFIVQNIGSQRMQPLKHHQQQQVTPPRMPACEYSDVITPTSRDEERRPPSACSVHSAGSACSRRSSTGSDYQPIRSVDITIIEPKTPEGPKKIKTVLWRPGLESDVTSDSESKEDSPESDKSGKKSPKERLVRKKKVHRNNNNNIVNPGCPTPASYALQKMAHHTFQTPPHHMFMGRVPMRPDGQYPQQPEVFLQQMGPEMYGPAGHHVSPQSDGSPPTQQYAMRQSASPAMLLDLDQQQQQQQQLHHQQQQQHHQQQQQQLQQYPTAHAQIHMNLQPHCAQNFYPQQQGYQHPSVGHGYDMQQFHQMNGPVGGHPHLGPQIM